MNPEINHPLEFLDPRKDARAPKFQTELCERTSPISIALRTSHENQLADGIELDRLPTCPTKCSVFLRFLSPSAGIAENFAALRHNYCCASRSEAIGSVIVDRK